MVDDWMMVGSDERNRQLDDSSGGGSGVRVGGHCATAVPSVMSNG